MSEEIHFTTSHLKQIQDHETRVKALESNTEILNALKENVVKLTMLNEIQNEHIDLMRADIKDLKTQTSKDISASNESIQKEITMLKQDVHKLEQSNEEMKANNDLKKTKWGVIGTAVAALIAAAASVIIALL